MGYRLLMLGPPVLLRSSDQNTDAIMLKSRKGQALLWYLATQPTVTFPREHLYGLLWDEVPTDTARRAFTTMLSRLRDELPVDCFHGTRGQLGWNPDAGIATDVADFLHRTDPVETYRGSASSYRLKTLEQKQAVYEAVSLWRGPFLDGFSCDSATYEEWMITQKHQLEMRMFTALKALLSAEKADENWEQVTLVGQRALEIDPLQETFHRAVMEALYRQGNRSAAIAQFEQCREALHEQLHTEPDAMTMELYENIRSSSTLGPGKITSASGRIVPHHVRSITQAMPPLIGRHREYSQVIEALRRTSHQGSSHIVLVHGEAGIGKTRLMAEMMNDAMNAKFVDAEFPCLLVGRGYEWMTGVPYATFVDALEPVIQDVDLSTLNLSDVWLRELGRLFPDVFVHRPDLKPVEPMESGDDRLRLFQAVARLLSSLPQPILLALDDMQWADTHSVNLLAYLLRHSNNRLSMATVVTVRDGDDTDQLRLTLSTLEREKRITRVTLNNLTKDDTFTLIQTLFPMMDGGEKADRIYSHSLGHPLYTVELASMLVDRSDVGNDSGQLPVPSTVQDVFVGRLYRLGNVATEVAGALSLFRQGATPDQLGRVTQLSEADILAAVQALTRAYIANESQDGTLSFRHDVFRKVVFENLPPSRRTHLHRQLYKVRTEELPSHSEHVPTTPLEPTIDQQLLADLITHSIGGSLWKEAFRWTRKAARQAEQLYAFSTAVEHLHTSLTCLDHLPVSHEHRQQRLDIELTIAKLDSWSPPHRRDARLTAVAQLAKEYGATAHLPLIHIAQAESLILQGRCHEAAVMLEKLAPLAPRDPRIALGLNAWQGAIDALTGYVKSALEHFSKVRDAMGEQVLKPGTSVYAGMAACYATAGDIEQADAALEAMEHEEKEQGYQSLTSKLLTVTATVAYLRGEWKKAVEYANRGLVTSRNAEDAANEALSALWLGAATLELRSESGAAMGQHEAIKVLEQALAASERAQTYTRRDFIYAFLALAYRQAGQNEQAAKAIESGLDLVERCGYMEGRALCTEIQGRMAVIDGELESARRHLEDALFQFEELGNVAGAIRCRGHLDALDPRYPRSNLRHTAD